MASILDPSQFECPICNEIPREKPFLKCKNMHKVCNDCYDKLPEKICPNGRCGYANPPKQDLHLFEIIRASNIDLPCKFKSSGCKFEGHGEKLAAHEKQCLLTSYLKCTHCFAIPRNGKIYICSGDDMHNICTPCFDGLPEEKVCPKGQCMFEDPPQRNRDAEEMLARGDFDFKCKYAANGCPQEAKKKQIAAHEGKCVWRPVTCPCRTCDKKLPYKQVLEHIKTDHPKGNWKDMVVGSTTSKITKTYFINKDSLKAESFQWQLIVVPFNGEHFFLNMEKKDHLYHAWVSMLGKKADCQSFKATVTLHGNNYSFGAFDKPVFHFQAPEKQLFFQEGDLVLTEHMAKQALSNRGVPEHLKKLGLNSLAYSFEIKTRDNPKAPEAEKKGKSEDGKE